MASHSHGQSVPTAPHSGNVPMHPDQLSKDDNSGDEEEEWDGENNAELESIHGYLGDTISAASREANAGHTWLKPLQTSDNTPHQDALNNQYVWVMHVNGIHHITLVTCACHGAEAIHTDLMHC